MFCMMEIDMGDTGIVCALVASLLTACTYMLTADCPADRNLLVHRPTVFVAKRGKAVQLNIIKGNENREKSL